jgi:hypothetical protein
MRRARASAPPQYRDDPLLRFRGDRPVLGARKHPQLQLHKSEPPDCNPSPHLFPVEYFSGIRKSRDQYFGRVKSRLRAPL